MLPLKILLKEFKTIFTSFRLLVLFFVGPIFLIFFMGGVYSHDYLDNVNIAVLDEDNSSLSRMVVQQFVEDDMFNFTNYASDQQELEELINERKAYMGVYIPKDFSKDVMSLQGSEVVIFIDGTNIVIGNNVYSRAATIVGTLAAGTQMKLIQARGVGIETARKLAMPFETGERTLYDPKMRYANYLLIGIITLFMQSLMMSGVGGTLIIEREYIAQGHMVMKVLAKIIASGTCLLATNSVAVLIAKNVWNVPMVGNISDILLISAMFLVAISAPAIILSVITKDRTKFVQISYMLSLPTFASAGYLWTVPHMPEGIVTGVKMFWPLIYFARNFDEILFKGLSLDCVKTDMKQMMLYIAVWLPISLIILKLSLRRENKKATKALIETTN